MTTGKKIGIGLLIAAVAVGCVVAYKLISGKNETANEEADIVTPPVSGLQAIPNNVISPIEQTPIRGVSSFMGSSFKSAYDVYNVKSIY